MLCWLFLNMTCYIRTSFKPPSQTTTFIKGTNKASRLLSFGSHQWCCPHADPGSIRSSDHVAYQRYHPASHDVSMRVSSRIHIAATTFNSGLLLCYGSVQPTGGTSIFHLVRSEKPPKPTEYGALDKGP